MADGEGEVMCRRRRQLNIYEHVWRVGVVGGCGFRRDCSRQKRYNGTVVEIVLVVDYRDFGCG